MTHSPAARLAVDIGGTFTDVVLALESGKRLTTKQLTTHAHPGDAVLAGIDRVMNEGGLEPADIRLIIHGTTLATNALIERRGAVTALLTTEGHRDALEMAHEDRFEQYDIGIDRPRPLVPRYLRLPVRERLDHLGRVLTPLDERSVEAALAALDEHGVQSVTIGFLHAFVNPAHERRTAEILAEARPNLSLTLASEVCPEIREFERLSTACANAYVRPLMTRYLDALSGELETRGYRCPFLLMTSGGGLTTLDTATRFPIRLVESGPAGGAILAARVAAGSGLNRVLSFDMGGTTAKLSFIDDGKPLASRSFEVDRVYRFRKGSGLPVRIPVIEMVEIGAGGGSLAHVDKLGRLNVGPESAGSEPGPACYGRGGSRAAVTDADVVLGRIVAERFAGGAFRIDIDAATAALDADVGQPLKLPVDAAAFALSEIVDENMASAARAHAAEFGVAPADRAMVAFGGAAPLHAVRLGEKLGVGRIVVPPSAGVGSAVGFLLAAVAYEVVRSRHQYLSSLDAGIVNALTDAMRDEALGVVRLGSPNGDLVETRQAYMRYVGQGHELAVDLPGERCTDRHGDLYRQLFETAYTQLYGRTIDGVEIEVLSWTLTLAAPAPAGSPPVAASRETPAPRPVAQQALFDPPSERTVDAPVYVRDALGVGDTIDGPALVTEDQTTTVVTSGWTVTVDAFGNLVLNASGDRDDG